MVGAKTVIVNEAAGCRPDDAVVGIRGNERKSD
jgi:hypothetical protein